ncbi:radical SAM/SPASM domain-containing protein [Butyrivibrio sp.]|jgi:MoaA/NifB/PqqE/SkfB family radical SAM enzyme|uniref:radical SAM/SPASM domain-containing protein n=1 Tax=Butyrivibrio sp. TaxID=28121 RepID=UPI0025C4124E|nr:radical SAM/SPASM domain-containing protein [Butyrivibrio sp.]MBE5833951.1 radical SAM protein [Butyrivibrio sp.]MBQ9303925.1 SPASM domain-containing protein [Butyrivibrio sp.]
MPITINNFMGKLGWNARKYLPNLASNAYLKLQFFTRGKAQREYTEYFMNAKEVPQPNVVNIETINRCNSTCAFCTANVHAEKRPLMKIDDGLYRSIIDQLADWNYKGHLTLYGNNEPWLDTRIVEFHKYAREKLPESFIFMSTNGLILTLEKVNEIKPYINQLIINNYSMEMKLHPNIQKIYDYVKSHPEEYKDLDIQIQMRYLQEVLTNRAGSAPNKKATEKVIKETCLLPFTDAWIMPNGKLGLCCCDNFEVTDFGDLNTTPLKEVWSSPKFMEARRAIAEGRQEYPFCKHCDFIDAGFRMQVVKKILAGDIEGAHRTGGEEKNKLRKK